MLHSDGDRCIAIKGCASSKHFVHDDAEGIDVGGRADDFALGLLRGIILHGAEGHTGRGETLGVDIFVDAGDAKVGELD